MILSEQAWLNRNIVLLWFYLVLCSPIMKTVDHIIERVFIFNFLSRPLVESSITQTRKCTNSENKLNLYTAFLRKTFDECFKVLFHKIPTKWKTLVTENRMKSCRRWKEKVILQGIIGYMAIVTPIKLFWQQSQNNSKTFLYFWPLLLLSTLTLFLWQNIKKKTVLPAFKS